ncbi:hypothetical protein PIB30_070525 [Stylosanthes scabra]|uniref:Uncharacterized protein n=1 Tax=Stylosanthes scabra TaxID=79078 RepID=A0ABU6RNG2_9FABA|nr:hypothetical protein [Stylosanthes scabra]
MIRCTCQDRSVSEGQIEDEEMKFEDVMRTVQWWLARWWLLVVWVEMMLNVLQVLGLLLVHRLEEQVPLAQQPTHRKVHEEGVQHERTPYRNGLDPQQRSPKRIHPD